VVSELERVCDYLIVLTAGRVQVSDDVDKLISSHKVLSGPAEDVTAIEHRWPIVSRSGGSRQARLLIRTGPPNRFEIPTGWQVSETNLEELVLCYLRAPEAAAFTGPSAIGGASPAWVVSA
jgi:ABC-2 type transport system ATP-binding protein